MNSIASIYRPQELISCPTELNFGDCCTGSLSYQLLTIKNVSEDRLDIHFRSEVSVIQYF